ncbi:N-acetyltransferase [Pedobacter yulinensis]|uniref:N-acetyltransferase n=1 Tax=Pedobacter yulinensis TaxID=2126353 RepID=A0A2T3HPJ1_9SPHI|nr:GNAT family N-acetyltransferase [Pedobacter yulinensis]PST84346.1 N-acetyltransferase [Pedobacter yulinensis]
MKTFENSKVTKNEKLQRFELAVEEDLAILEYREKGGVYSLVHTEVPVPLRGKGIANFLIEQTLKQLEREGHQIRPLCRAVSAFVERHPEWERLLART